MWRRHGDTSYIVLVLGVFTLEILALAALVWTFSLRLGGLGSETTLEEVLIAAVLTMALGLLGITVYILAFHALSDIGDRRRDGLLGQWTERWLSTIFSHEEPPKPPLTPEAEEAALELRALLQGEDGLALSEVLERYEVDRRLIRKMGSRRLSYRLEALQDLARGRFRAAFYPLIPLLAEGDAVIRLMSGRALARTLAEWPSGQERDAATSVFAIAVKAAALPAGATVEILLLLEGSARPVLTALLLSRRDRTNLVRGALDATGRLGLIDLKELVIPWIDHPEPEVRAAALRALGKLGRVPRRVVPEFVAAFGDDTEFVRVQAARAASGLSQRLAVPILYEGLADPSWWVRRASAESLLQLGARGQAALRRAARSHLDRYARDMSAQVLIDAAQPGLDRAGRLEEIA
jgi:HEAT repeat protein